ncbi:MAG: NAD(P)-dependent oxidoreductase [Cyanobacteria bacterium J06623_7]
MAEVTILGMGAMGSRMALSLIKAEHQVTVWNRHSDKTKKIVAVGAKVAATPRAAVQNADYVISMVRDDTASQAVWLGEMGALASMKPEAIAIASSTLTTAWVKELGQKFQQQGIAFIDAPVAGTRPQAEAAQLIYFVGGDPTICDRARPILQAMGSQIHYVGDIGSGMAIKLAVNSLFAVQVSAMAEIMQMMHHSGIDKARAREVIAATPICSPAAALAGQAIVAQKFAPLFPIELVEKDLNYSLAQSFKAKADLPLIVATQKIYQRAIERGYGEDNITGVAQLYQLIVKSD